MFELIKNNHNLNNIESFLDRFFSDSIYNYNNYVSNIDYNYSYDEDNYYIELALPCLDKKDINMNVVDNYLHLDYSSQEKDNSNFWNQSFNKKIKLPTNINLDTISAQLKNGILSIVIERIKIESKMKKITIK
jgi:HSP20 family protein